MASSLDLAGTARSLLNIEANTIIRDNMTAEPMPPVPHALLDLASQYSQVLCGLRVDLRAYFAVPLDGLADTAPAWVPNPSELSDLVTVSADTFDRLRWAAKHAMRPGVATASSDRVLLDRIVNNCDAIKEMFKRFGAAIAPYRDKSREQLTELAVSHAADAINVDDLVVLQKMWDIGTETIVAQTIVRVTGDVTTRVQRELTLPGGESLFAIHRQTVDVSISCWRNLVRVVSEIAGNALRALLGPQG
jgi:hypothetical protein